MGKSALLPIDYLPLEVDGWRAAGEDRIYDATDLFDYIDGAAEPYLHYGFRQVAARRFVREGQPAIIVDFFDMGTSENAFGIFSFEREGKDVGLGQGSEYDAGFMRFWKGRFFISIFAEQETPEAKEAMFGLGKAIDRAITETGPEPDLLALLPRENLLEERVRYFRYHMLLNYHYYVADDNILHLDGRTEAILASYRNAGGNVRLLLVRYLSVEESRAAFADFLQSYAPESMGRGTLRTENGKWMVAQRQANLIVIVFDAPSEEQAQSLIELVRGKQGKERR